MTLSASACAKVILLGEHAVVYGIPALAAPVSEVRATATLTLGGAGLRIVAPAVQVDAFLDELGPLDPLAAEARLVGEFFHRELPKGLLEIRSEIPMASGMGSGAAVCAAMVRVLSRAFGQEATPEEVSAMVLEIERLHHGTPSGIDNTVIAFEKPICFVRGQPPAPLAVGRPFWLLIGDSGQPSPTRDAVAGVRDRMQSSPSQYGTVLENIRRLVERAKIAIATGAEEDLGLAMTSCHRELQRLEVSNPRLDLLVNLALDSGALGAKLSGAGLGGIVIALVRAAQREQVIAAWKTHKVAWSHSTRIA